ncbi:MAG: hypothetical protein F6K41_30180 [Symploca sp. SIO3E6]|nr:hypothetical protein [Caldora sp. SIO3E6]
MNIKNFAIAISCIAILAATIPAIAQMSIQMNEGSIRIEGNGISLESSSDGIFVESGTQGQNSVRSSNQSISVESDSNEVNITQENTNMPTSASSTEDYQVQQLQQTIISLNTVDTTQPHILSISAPTATELTGEIQIDSRVIQTLSNDNHQINLSPYLTTGRHTIEISGSYSPETASVTVEFTGNRKQITLQTGGDGNLSQTIIFDVR